MKLQILIPQYNEEEYIIKPLLDSIAIQQSINFGDIGVIIVNDGSDTILSRDFLNKYPFRIKYIQAEHKGVSATRNACLDAATADYVMFCDADDMFYSVNGLWHMFNEMDIGFDSMVSVFIEETRHPENKSILYVLHERDATFVHGKIHRRQYLLDNNIRWNDNLTIHEDSYFNILCQSLSQNVKYCPTPFYLWKWRDNSVCRHDPKYLLKTYNNMIDSNEALVEEFSKRSITDKAAFYIAFLIFDAYYMMNKPAWINQENKEYRDKTEKRFAEYYRKHKEIWDKIDVKDKMQISNGVRSRAVGEGMLMESVTIEDWINQIISKY